MVKKAKGNSAREAEDFIDTDFEGEGDETIVLREKILEKLDQLREKYNDPNLSSHELLDMMLKKELEDPCEEIKVSADKIASVKLPWQ